MDGSIELTRKRCTSTATAGGGPSLYLSSGRLGTELRGGGGGGHFVSNICSCECKASSNSDHFQVLGAGEGVFHINSSYHEN